MSKAWRRAGELQAGLMNALGTLGKAVMALGLYTSGAASAMVMVAGFRDVIWGAVELLWATHGEEGLIRVFHGLDLILLSPMAFISVNAILDFFEGLRGELGIDQARDGFVRAKSLLMGLLAAAVGVHLGEILIVEDAANWVSVAMHGAAIAVLGAYSLALDKR